MTETVSDFDFTILDPPKRKFGGRQEGAGRKKKPRPPSIDQVYPGLPDSTNPASDALWCYNNAERMVEEHKEHGILIWWDRARDAPPSRGVVTWMTLRQKAGYKDFNDRLNKAVLGKDDEADEGDVQRYEKKRIEDVRKILEAMLT